MQIFPHRDVDMWGHVWMRRFRRAWSSLNFYKEYIFGFETLVFVTSGILSMQKLLLTLQRGKLEIVSYDLFKLIKSDSKDFYIDSKLYIHQRYYATKLFQHW